MSWVSRIFLLLTASTLAFGAVPPLFVVHSNPPNKWTADLELGLKKSIQGDRWRKTLNYFFHNTYWLTRTPEEQKSEKDRILGIIASSKPSAVLLCDDEANDFLARDLVSLGYPVFTVGVNRLPEFTTWNDLTKAGKVSGVFETWPVERALGLMERHFPNKKRFSIVTSETGTSDRIIEILQTPAVQKSIEKRGYVLRKIYRLREWEGWKSAITEANKTDDLAWFLIPYGVFDRDNVEVTPGRMVQWLNKNVTIPSIGSSVLRGGVAISIGVMAEEMGAEVGEVIESTLQSKRPFGGSFPTTAYRVNLAIPKR